VRPLTQLEARGQRGQGRLETSPWVYASGAVPTRFQEAGSYLSSRREGRALS
jgi:hypothetical protein